MLIPHQAVGQSPFRNQLELTSGTTPLVGNPGAPPPDSSLVSIQLECYVPLDGTGYEHIDHFEFQKATKTGDAFGAFAPFRTKDAAEIISGTKDGVPRRWMELITQTTLDVPCLFRARVVTTTATSFWSNTVVSCGLYAINNEPLLTLLYWSAIPGVTTYFLFRGITRTNVAAPLATINNVHVDSYRDTEVALGTDYSYLMRTDLALGDAFTFGPPTPPALFAAVADDTDPTAPFVTLSWQSGLGYLDSTGFQLQRAEGANDYASLLAEGDSLSHATTSYVDRTVTPGGLYRYQIRALTVIGPHSAWSDPQTVLCGPPALTVEGTAPTTIHLTWSASGDQDGWRLDRTSAASGDTVVLDDNLIGSPYDDTTVVLGQEYQYRIFAFLNGTPRLYSPGTYSAIIPTPPADLEAEVDGLDVHLSWTPGPGYRHVTGYVIQRSPGGAGTWTSIDTESSPETNSFVDTPPAAGSWDYRIKALCPSGVDSAWSDVVSATAGIQFRQVSSVINGDPGISSLAFTGDVQAGSLLVVVVGANTLASWTATISDSQSNAYTQVADYIRNIASAEPEKPEIGMWFGRAASSGPCTVSVSEISGSSGVFITVLEYTTGGATVALDNSSSQNDLAGSSPGTLSTGTIPVSGAGRLLVAAWQHDQIEGSVTAGSGFTLRETMINNDAGPEVVDQVGIGVPTEGVLTAPDSGYYAGLGASFKPAGPPAKPTGVLATRESPGEIDVTWDPELSTEGFQVWRSTDGVTYTLLVDEGTAVAFSYADNTATVGTLYWYKVKVYNANGFSPFSDPVSNP